MSSNNEKSVIVTTSDSPTDDTTTHNGLSLPSRPSPSRQQLGLVLSTIHDVESTHSLTPPQSATEIDEKHLSPYGYNSHSQRSDSKMNVNVYENDLEAQALTQEKTQASKLCSTSNILLTKTKSCVDPAWPGRNHLKQQKKMAKRDRACCRPWASLSKKNKAIVSVVVFLVILGVALGVGFGISSRVGGTITTGNGSSKPIHDWRIYNRYILSLLFDLQS